MERDYFLNAGIQPPLQFEPTMPAWNSLSSAQELYSSLDQTSSCFLNPNWDNQVDNYAQLESALSSMASSPVAPHSAVPAGALALRELIGKLGPTCNSGDMLQPFPAASVASTPFNSPPKRQLPVLNPALPALSADPGFAERAAKFSCFGSRSFNGRMSQFGHNNAELPCRSSTPALGSGKLTRVSSSPSIKQGGSPVENKNLGQARMEMRTANGLIPSRDKKFNELPSKNGAISNEESSSVSEQKAPSGETGLRIPHELNSKKRKAVAKGKAKRDASSQAVNASKGADTDAKRSKLTEANVSENQGVKTEEGKSNNNNKTGDDKTNQKPPDPTKDYIHVRARRGQATDAHSLAERVRREKISERMNLLQDLVPGCNKVIGKAVMLDEIINYVQSLQRQVEFLSMKLASVNPRLDSMDNLLSKDVFQPNASLPHPMFPLDSSEPALYKNQTRPNPQLHNNNGSADQIDTRLCRSLGLQLPPLDGFVKGLPQFPAVCEDDLHSIVQMGYNQNPERDAAFHSQSFPIANQTSHMKIEL